MTKRIRIYNPRTLIRDGSRLMLEDAARDDTTVFFRSGRLECGTGKAKRPRLLPDALPGKSGFAEAGDRVYKLVPLTPEEMTDYQAQADAQHDEWVAAGRNVEDQELAVIPEIKPVGGKGSEKGRSRA